MKEYYILGFGYRPSDIRKTRPFEVWLDVQNESFPMVMLEGKQNEGLGGSFSPSAIVKERWNEHLIITNTKWVIPFCEEAINNNDTIDLKAILSSYEYIHGQAATMKKI